MDFGKVLKTGLAGLSGLAGDTTLATTMRSNDIVSKLMENPADGINSPEFARLAEINPKRASAFQGMIKAQGDEAKRREQAMAIDAVSVYGHLQSGNKDGAIKTLENRLANIQALGGDPSDTAEIYSLVMSDQNDKAADLLQHTLAAFQLEGVLPGSQFVDLISTKRSDEEQRLIGNEFRDREISVNEGRLRQDEIARNDPVDQRDRMIRDYMRIYGMALEEATRAVDSKALMDDKGNLSVYDPITQTSRLVERIGGITPPAQDKVEDIVGSEDLAFDPAAGTGLFSAMIGVWNSTVGQIPFVPLGEETYDAANKLRTTERRAVDAMKMSNRPTLFEQERVAAMLPSPLDFSENPRLAYKKMTNFVDMIGNQYVDDMRYKSDPSNPKDVRESSARRANEIGSLIRYLLKPEAADAMIKSLNKIEAEISEVRTMPLSELKNIDMRQLTDAQFDVYEQRILSGQ